MSGRAPVATDSQKLRVHDDIVIVARTTKHLLPFGVAVALPEDAVR